jgi:hypothetical protein
MDDDGELIGGGLTPSTWHEFVGRLPLPEMEDDRALAEAQYRQAASGEGGGLSLGKAAAVDWYVRYRVSRASGDSKVRVHLLICITQ